MNNAPNLHLTIIAIILIVVGVHLIAIGTACLEDVCPNLNHRDSEWSPK